MLKIRLRRMGAIRQPHYRIVVADSRAPRDGAFIENLGHYNPLTNPATIQVDVAKYEEWKRKGAQPTEAVVSLVRQFNRTARAAAAAADATGTTATATASANAATPDRRTRTASGKRSEAATPAAAEAPEAPETPETAAATATATAEAPEAAAAEDTAPAAEDVTPEAPQSEVEAEATRDGGEGSDAIIGEAADEGTSANPGQSA
jgi:small subunit ribosomal protein S16